MGLDHAPFTETFMVNGIKVFRQFIVIVISTYSGFLRDKTRRSRCKGRLILLGVLKNRRKFSDVTVLALPASVATPQFITEVDA